VRGRSQLISSIKELFGSSYLDCSKHFLMSRELNCAILAVEYDGLKLKIPLDNLTPTVIDNLIYDLKLIE
jgi:hypothetical protein